MKTLSLFAIAATAVLGACAGSGPTGPDATAPAPSFNLVLLPAPTTTALPTIVGFDSTRAVIMCTLPTPDTTTTTQVSALGTYIVAYGGTCTPSR